MKLFGNTSRKGKNNENKRGSRPARPGKKAERRDAADFFPEKNIYEARQDDDAEGMINSIIAETSNESAGLSPAGPAEASFDDEEEAVGIPDEGPVSRGKRRHKLTGMQRGLVILGGAVVLLVVLVLVIWNAFATPPEIALPTAALAASESPAQSGGIHITVTTMPTSAPSESPAVSDETENIAEVLNVPTDRKNGWYTVLLVGTDYSEYLTDTIIACSFDTVNHKLNLVSIPRDTFINIKKGFYKINSAFTAGINSGKTMQAGMDSLLSEVTKILGFQVDAYCMINLESFVDIVDIIGGVEFDVPCNMSYDDPAQDLHIHLTAGEQLLDGEKCMELVRYRSYPAADLQRVQVQQDFMKALAKKLLSIGTLGKVNELAQVLSDSLFTNLSLGNIAWFGEELLKVNVDDITTMTLTGEGGGWDGASYYFLYGYDTVDTVNKYLNPYEQDYTIDDIYVYTLENGVISRSLRSTQYNQHAYSNYGYSSSSSSTSSSSSSSSSASSPSPSSTGSAAVTSEPDSEEEAESSDSDDEGDSGQDDSDAGTDSESAAPSGGDGAAAQTSTAPVSDGSDQPDDTATQTFG